MSVPDSVIIDDSDPSIVYEAGKWVTDTSFLNFTVSGRPFNNTAHITYEQASFTITFQGTGIELWGLSSSPSTTWNGSTGGVAIDSSSTSFGGVAGPGQEPSFRFSAGYDPTSWEETSANTLKMTVNGSKDNPVAFDFARFTPSGFGKATDIKVGILEYAVYESNDVPKGWDNSDFLSTSTPDAPYIFNFTGTSIAALGGNGVNDSHIQALASYSIDGGAPVNFTVNNLANSILNDVTEQTIFQTSQYTLGNHSLQMVYHGDNTTTPLTIMSLLVTTTNSSLSVDPAPPPESTTSVSTSSSMNPAPTRPTSPLAHVKNPHRAAIAAAIAVTLTLLVVLFIVGFLLYRRRQRRFESKRYSSYSVEPGPVAMAIVPFSDGPTHTSGYHLVAENNSNSHNRKDVESLSQGRTDRTGTPQQESNITPNTTPRIVTRMHEDSGILLQQPAAEQVVVVDVPPSYTSLNDSTPRQSNPGERNTSRKGRSRQT